MIKFHSKYTPNCTVVISNFQKFSGEGLTEPPPQTPPPASSRASPSDRASPDSRALRALDSGFTLSFGPPPFPKSWIRPWCGPLLYIYVYIPTIPPKLALQGFESSHLLPSQYTVYPLKLTMHSIVSDLNLPTSLPTAVRLLLVAIIFSPRLNTYQISSAAQIN